MSRSRLVPLAWLNLTHNLVRMLLFCAGIGFAVVLMFIQYGCLNALLDASVLLQDQIDAHLFLVSTRETTALLRAPFPREVLMRAKSLPGVREVHPLYLEYITSVLRHTAENEKERNRSSSIRVVGIDPGARLLRLPLLNPNKKGNKIDELRKTGTALFDTRSKRAQQEPERPPPKPGETIYGVVKPGTQTELAGKTIQIVGLFNLGVDFGCDGTLIVSNATFEQCLRPPFLTNGLEDVDIGLVRLDSEDDLWRVQRELTSLLQGSEVEVLTKAQLLQREKDFWSNNTPIGAVFGFGMFMGFIVGMVICYQILSSDIRDNLSAYATLRAIGYSNAYLRQIVMQEALLLAVLGFVPGLLVSWGMYEVLAWITGLPLNFTLWRISFIFFLTVGLCVGSGWLAVRQAQQADPAEVF